MDEIKEFIIKNHIIYVIAVIILTWFVAFIASKIMSRKVLVIPRKLSKKEKAEFNAAQFTKLKMIKRLFLFLIWAVGISIALLKVEGFRTVGTALLASAGFVSLVAGLAARSSLSNLIAGITIAFAQPIRLKDYVTVDNEFGQVDEMTLLFTIIKTWDKRRLIVPNQVIVSSPIRNYSIEEKEILAEAIIPVSYGADVELAKKILTDIAKQSKYHDPRKVPEVRVVELGMEVINLRVLALAKDPKCAYALSTEIKEKVVLEFPKKSIGLGKKQ